LFVNSLVDNWRLILRMTKRDVVGRYRGSLFGIVWSFFNPLLMLAVYSFVFGLVFKAKWGTDTTINFAVILFTGLIFHGFLGECIGRAPGIIVANATYVKKVVFPLDTLIWVSVFSSLFHFFISLFILMLALIAFSQSIPWTWVYLPFVLLPLFFVCLGISWLLASLGVFIRDIAQMTGIVVTILLFLCPIVYPLEVIPEVYQKYILMNPLTIIVEQARAILVFGKAPDFMSLFLYGVAAVIFCQLSYLWFSKTKRGFADVL
jgi:lipopolysaccharide transport system permease protein